MTTKKPIKARDLTPMQRATLALVVMHCDLTLCHPRTGSVMLKRLVKLGLLNVCDSSYPGSKQTTWSATAAGKALADGHWYDWLHAVGWSWIHDLDDECDKCGAKPGQPCTSDCDNAQTPTSLPCP